MTTTTARPIKVKVSVTLEIDPEAWATEYNCELSEVREDVRRWATNGLQQQIDAMGLGR